MLDNLAFALGVTGPIFLVFSLGIILKRIGLINNEFAQIGSDLAFKVALPCLLFTKLSTVSFADPPLLLLIYALCATTLVFLVLERFVTPLLMQPDRSAFVQGAFRGNMGVVGLAFALNTYGEGILSMASVYLAILTILYNVLSLITLNRHLIIHAKSSPFLMVAKNVSRNPLILAVVLALFVSYFQIPVPGMVLKPMDYLAGMALPLAVLCSGASIRWREFHSSVALYWGVAAKLVFIPGVIVLGGILIGLRGEMLGLLFFMVSAPTATMSYPMIRSLGGNHYLAAALIALSSLLSVVAVTAGLFLLRELELV